MGLRTSLPRTRDRLRLGRSPLTVSPFCVGGVRDPETIPLAFDAGINAFFLSADMHWPLYEGSRRGLAQLFARGGSVRDDVVVFVCSYVAQPEFGFAPFHEVIHAVPGLERVDVLVAGGAYAADARVRAERFRASVDDRFVGAQAVGVTFHDRIAARDLLDEECLDIAFVRYNASHSGALRDLFPHARRKRDTLLFNFKSTMGFVAERVVRRAELDEDVWIPTVSDHYRFVLSRPELDGVLCSPTTPQELEALLEALERGPLDTDDEEHLIALANAASSLR